MIDMFSNIKKILIDDKHEWSILKFVINDSKKQEYIQLSIDLFDDRPVPYIDAIRYIEDNYSLIIGHLMLDEEFKEIQLYELIFSKELNLNMQCILNRTLDRIQNYKNFFERTASEGKKKRFKLKQINKLQNYLNVFLNELQSGDINGN